MTTSSRRFELVLATFQAAGGVGLCAAWLVASARGWPILALLAAGSGAGLGLAATYSLGRSFKVTPTPREGARLVQSGVYRWLRHPMYVAVLLILLAAALSRPSITVLVISALNFTLYLVKARYEEAVLLEHYDEYHGYRGRSVGVKADPATALRRGSGWQNGQDEQDENSTP